METNALIAVDKPLGLTSHDVVSRVVTHGWRKRVCEHLGFNASGVLGSGHWTC